MKAQVVLAFSMFALAVHGQGWQESGMEHPWEQYLNEVLTVDEMESASWETTYDLLCELEQQPLDINMVTREQLEELPFLSAHHSRYIRIARTPADLYENKRQGLKSIMLGIWLSV